MRPPRLARVVLLVGAAATVAGALLLVAAPVGSVGRVPQPPVVATQPSPATGVAAPLAATPGRAPVSLQLPGQGGRSLVRPVTVGPDGALGVPDDPAVLGWWSGSATPGAGRGSIVIDGHLDSARYGVGVFAQLRELAVGERIAVGTGPGGTRSYLVTARRSYDKGDLPVAVFDQQVGERLVLITCGGAFDRRTRHYSQNTVVYAVPDTAAAAGPTRSGADDRG